MTVADARPSVDLVSSDGSAGSADACRRARRRRDRIEGSADRVPGSRQQRLCASQSRPERLEQPTLAPAVERAAWRRLDELASCPKALLRSLRRASQQTPASGAATL